jgi:hypothetical protein
VRAVIGPHWADADNLPRLKAEGDMVRHDLVTALTSARQQSDSWGEMAAQAGLGDLAVALGSLPEAMAAYDTAMRLSEKGAQDDPANTEWQRDLSVSHRGRSPPTARGSLLARPSPRAIPATRNGKRTWPCRAPSSAHSFTDRVWRHNVPICCMGERSWRSSRLPGG